MWPVFYALGQRFSNWLVFPIATIIGTVGYYAEKKLRPRPPPIPYLEESVIEARQRRLLTATGDEDLATQRARTLHISEPAREK
ncbi:unnamed protein product, partial [Mesorhabditis spiculigera]